MKPSNPQRLMDVTRLLVKFDNKLASNEEAILNLVSHNCIDFNSGMEFVQNLKDTSQSTENLNADGLIYDGTEKFSYPDQTTAVVIKTTLELASPDEQKSFVEGLDKLNVAFQEIYRKHRSEIFNAVTNLKDANPAEVLGENAGEADRIMGVIKSDKILFVNH